MKSVLIHLSLALLIALLAVGPSLPAGTALAQSTWYVSTAGNDTSGDGSQANPWRTIQYAVSQAFEGDTVIVAAGEYVENVTIGKALTLEGAQAGVDARDRTGDETVVVGDPTALYATVTAMDIVTIDGFTIKGYRAALDIESARSRVLNNIVMPTRPAV